MQHKQSVRRDANVERLRQMLTDLADANGTVHKWAHWELANECNKRYATETRPIGTGAIQGYIKQAKVAGWLSSQREVGDPRRLILILVPAGEQEGVA